MHRGRVDMSSDARLTMDLIGYNDTLKALRGVDAVAAKQLRVDMRTAASVIVRDARAHVTVDSPRVSGWRTVEATGKAPWTNRGLTRSGAGWPAWNVSDIRRTIKVSTRRSKPERGKVNRTTLSIRSKSAALTVYEFAKNSRRSKSFPYVNSVPFVNRLGSYHGGRILWSAFERNKSIVGDSIKTAVKSMNRIVQGDINAANDKVSL